MGNHIIIDRRKNPTGKNLPNRQRFLKKVKKNLSEKIKKKAQDSITDVKGGTVDIPADDISEPSFGYDNSGGIWDRVFPGNKEFQKGDTIKKPPGGAGGGRGGASGQGSDEDTFTFTLDRDEYLDILFEGLELPDLVKKSQKTTVSWKYARAGFKNWGPPPTIDLVRSYKNSLARRFALAKPLEKQIEELEKKDPKTEEEEKELKDLKKRRKALPWLDPLDIRYRRWEKQPVSNSQAVMFCLMDVSASMEEIHKTIAKRFFLLLNLFLEKKYRKVDIVFVRHTDVAKECNQEEFFYGKESGGTQVSSGLGLIKEIIAERYPIDQWNIYITQASDGDNYVHDNEATQQLMKELLPIVQYFIYIQVSETVNGIAMAFFEHISMWDMYSEISRQHPNLCNVKISDVDEIVGTFRQIFTKEAQDA